MNLNRNTDTKFRIPIVIPAIIAGITILLAILYRFLCGYQRRDLVWIYPNFIIITGIFLIIAYILNAKINYCIRQSEKEFREIKNFLTEKNYYTQTKLNKISEKLDISDKIQTKID